MTTLNESYVAYISKNADDFMRDGKGIIPNAEMEKISRFCKKAKEKVSQKKFEEVPEGAL